MLKLNSFWSCLLFRGVGGGYGGGGERSLGFKGDIHFRRSLFLFDFLGSQCRGQIYGGRQIMEDIVFVSNSKM